MPNDLVSVVIPTHRRPTAIVARAAQSALQQSHRNLEVFVVDDSGPAYPGREAVKRMLAELDDPRLRYVAHDINRGACAARNTGCALARGEFVAFLDDDDEWLPEKLARQLPLFADARVGLVYCREYVVDDESGARSEPKRPLRNGMCFDALLRHNFIGSTSFVVLRKACLADCGGFDEAMPAAQDADMWLRVGQKYAVAGLDEALVLYHAHAAERISADPARKLRGLEALNRKYLPYLKEHRALYSTRVRTLVPYCVLAGETKKARACARLAVRLCPRLYKDNLSGLLCAYCSRLPIVRRRFLSQGSVL